jgi:hypothetical protein
MERFNVISIGIPVVLVEFIVKEMWGKLGIGFRFLFGEKGSSFIHRVKTRYKTHQPPS